MKYQIDLDHDLKIIHYTHSGIILAEEIEYVWVNEFLKMKEFTELKYNLCSDYSKAKFNIPVEFLPELMEFMHSIKSIIKGKKQSIIVEDAYSTAASILLKNEVSKDVGFIVEIFSTKEAALEWLTL